MVAVYLQHVALEKRLAPRTVALYAHGLQRLLALGQTLAVPLCALQPQHIRRSVAQWHSQGGSSASIALGLSCWRGFFHWLAGQHRVQRNPVQGIRPPKAAQRLPKALPVDAAVQLAAFAGETSSTPWQEARAAALTELLYSSGLRVSELVGLDAQPSAQALGWVDEAAALVHVLGKGGKRRSVPVDAAKTAAIFGTLLIHASAAGGFAGAPGSFGWTSALFWNCLLRSAVPVFFLCSGALLLPPEDPSACTGVIFFNNVGCLGMCGHGTIALSMAMVAHRLAPPPREDGLTRIRFETTAGLVVAEVASEGDTVLWTRFENVPAYVAAQDIPISLPGYGDLKARTTDCVTPAMM